MAKIREGLPLSITFGTLVNYAAGVDDYGNEYVMLYFVAPQLMPSLNLVLSQEQILAEHANTKPENKPYNLKFKIPKSRQELTVGLEIGNDYFIEYAQGMSGLKSDKGNYVDYQAMSMQAVGKQIGDRWRQFIKDSQQQRQAQTA